MCKNIPSVIFYFLKEDAFKVAKQIAGILKIDILDATEAESKWI
ncbi:hypothetical protein [Kordia antarctica]|nr:hypothetical protein [Kordia antarctica]